MKILGAAIIFVVSVAVGLMLGEKKKKGVRECEAFLELFRYTRSQISCFDTPTKLIWRGFENDVLEKNGFLPALRRAEGDDVYFDAFSHAINETEATLCVSEDAKKIIRSFGSSVGKSFSEQQLSIIDICVAQMNETLEKSRAEAQRDAKLYLTLGFAFGAVIFIMLL